MTERTLRRRARREGYAIQKARTDISTRIGEYRVVNLENNYIQHGQENYPLSFDDLISWFGSKEEKEVTVSS